ncbi:MAG TPA: penicillin-binding transpeptidase domain-containing protein [Blastocatellia bacterium]|nr:penicillin-binding transpeptidase domain-containing protein [Blastocatellia bacterium]
MLIPLSLTIAFIVIGLLLSLILMWAAWRHRNPQTIAEEGVPEDVRDFGPSATNRWIKGLRAFFILLLLTVVGFHSYWVFKADSNETFTRAKLLDRRNIRLAESGLKGWVLDRTGDLNRALIKYKYEDGFITRDYPLGEAAVHVTGFSDALLGGIEYGYRDWLSKPASTYNWLASPIPVGQDLKLSIDGDLQRFAYEQLKATGKQSAAVVLLLPTNEVLAMASYPSFNPNEANDENRWRTLTDQAEDPLAQHFSPLVNRVTGTLVTGGPTFYYHPGSTFKTFIAAIAIDNNMTNEVFTCRAEGFTPPGAHDSITDFEGEVHGRIDFADAFRVSCNQYFAQLGLKLHEKGLLLKYAQKLGFTTSPVKDIQRDEDLWLAPSANIKNFNYIFAPPVTRMILAPKPTPYEVALQAFGQGEGDLTVISMALIASVAANNGQLIAPTFEAGAQPKLITQFISPKSAAQLRQLMRSVVESGTAAGAFAPLAGRITAGGKTGTADQPISVVDYIDKQGKAHYRGDQWTNSWFIGFAPADNPQIAFAVLVENGGQGAKAAAPIAEKLVEQALRLNTSQGQAAQVPARSNQQGAKPAR